jgi:hypothetical protein
MNMDAPTMSEKYRELSSYSDFNKAQENAFLYLGDFGYLFVSPREDKKYRVFNPDTKAWVDFGQMGATDYTKHQDEARRNNYLKRATAIRGDWWKDKYSPNNLAIHILWQ